MTKRKKYKLGSKEWIENVHNPMIEKLKREGRYQPVTKETFDKALKALFSSKASAGH